MCQKSVETLEIVVVWGICSRVSWNLEMRVGKIEGICCYKSERVAINEPQIGGGLVGRGGGDRKSTL